MENGTKYNTEDLIESVIAPNLKGSDATNFVLMGGKKIDDMDDLEDEWKDCPNNPKSDKFGGVHFHEIRKKEWEAQGNREHYMTEHQTKSISFADIVATYESEDEEFYH
mmetsp:Transcript_48258/g.71517  ORF Transcript_48258/g.71517 Transcript_48258/m.71517 type:complete len:109 (-) Transcript_48258:27-353(-)